MNLLILSNVLLWILVLVLSITVYALLRQVGVLYERIAPAGALMVAKGPAVGDLAGEMLLPNINTGEEIMIGAPSATGRGTLLFFLSPTCPVCESLLPTLKLLAKAESDWLDVVFTSDGELTVQRDFVRRKGLENETYIVSESLGLHFQISKLPYGVLIDQHGKVSAHGLTNSREHIESLFSAMEMGMGSIQEYMQQQQRQHQESHALNNGEMA